jgi:quercetin dioxygenase-like cupin family protein
MKRATTFAGAAVAAGIALAFGVGVAVGQNTAPTENKGVTVSQPTALDLSGEIDGVAGRQLRLRTVTLAPGGVVALHSHNGRPAVATVMQGTLTEHRDNGVVVERKQGESWTEGKEVTHWAENKGDVAVVVIAVDVFKP